MIVPDAGHSALEPGIRAALVNATESFRLSMSDDELFAPRFPWEAAKPSMSFELPPEQTGAAAWYGPEMRQAHDWLMPLGAAEIAEVEAGDQGAGRARGRHRRDHRRRISRCRRSAPSSRQRVEDEVLNGRGFLLLRGLPVERWTMREAATAFFGLGAHLGSARSQNGKGHVLGHVQDLGLAVERSQRAHLPDARAADLPHRFLRHRRACCASRPRKSGGLSALVSSTTIFNEMRRRRPDLLKLLFQPVATDRRGEVPEGQKPYFEIPLFNWLPGPSDGDLPAASTSIRRSASPTRRGSTPAHVEALDMFDALANDPALHMFMEFKPGDVQLVHNHTILHDRTGFEDWPEPRAGAAICCACGSPPTRRGRCRRSSPSATAASTIGDRGGIIVRGTRLHAPLEAV